MYKTTECMTRDQLDDFLNGTVMSGPLEDKTYGLHGLTLVINNGSADITTTFSDATNAGLSPKDILTQIRAADATMSYVLLRNYGFDVKKPSLAIPRIGYILRAGTSNATFKLPATNTTVTEILVANVVYAGPSNGIGAKYMAVIHT